LLEVVMGGLFFFSFVGRIEKPDFVFLVHEIGLDSVLHLPMSFIGFHSTPFQHRWFVALFMPLSVPLMLLMWFFGTPFLGFQYHLHHLHSQLWVMPRFGFQVRTVAKLNWFLISPLYTYIMLVGTMNSNLLLRV
jgi:hypothetical protein